MRIPLSGALVMLLHLPCAAQSILDVPGEYPTIMDAVIAATSSDIVRVAPGVYVETVDDLGKGIAIISTGGPAVTEIRKGTTGAQTVDLSHGVLDGFTVSVGDLSGITLAGDAMVVNCVVTDNEGVDGGGIRATGGTIVDTVVTGNSAQSGGGIHATGDTEIIGCVVSDNEATGNGGGIYLSGATCRDSVITANSANEGGGVYETAGSGTRRLFDGNIVSLNFAATKGGGVSSAGLLVDCLIVGNIGLENGGGVWGGATLMDSQLLENEAENGGGGSSGTYYNCEVRGNVASDRGGGVFGGALRFCVLRDNEAANGGGAWGSLDLRFCTVVGNSATVSGDGLELLGTASVRDSIIWDDTIELLSPTATVQDCVIQGGLPSGVGIIVSDPQFEVGPLGDLYLAPTSPARDASSSPADLFMAGTTSATEPIDAWPYDLGHHYQSDLGPIDVGRGDPNQDGVVDLADAVLVIFYLFVTSEAPCVPRCDVNADDTVDLSDSVYLLNWLFVPGAPAPASECRPVLPPVAAGCLDSGVSLSDRPR